MTAVETIINTEQEALSDIAKAEQEADAKVSALKQSLDDEFQKEIKQLQISEKEQLESAHQQAAKEAETIIGTYEKQASQISTQSEAKQAEMVKKIIAAF